MNRKQTTLWTTKQGEKIRICDMTDSHLMNSIRMLERKAGEFLRAEISAAYSVLCGLQGEMAQFCCEQDIDTMEETEPEEWLEAHCPIYEKLCAEAERRNLPIYERQ